MFAISPFLNMNMLTTLLDEYSEADNDEEEDESTMEEE